VVDSDVVRSTIRFSRLSSALVEAVSSHSLGRFLSFFSKLHNTSFFQHNQLQRANVG
ncbi:hypothetical protein S245_032263, partial [Arachis hypogaea]